MSRVLFGTDGIRGVANVHPMTADMALKVGMAAGAYFCHHDHNIRERKVLIGKDTRLSGYMIESALTAGFISMGVNVLLVGPMPTPGVAMLTRSFRADIGVMITASHNHYQDNGIKLFDSIGLKLSDDVEHNIEKLMCKDMNKFLATSDHLGRAKRLDDASGRYIQHVKSSFPRRKTLSGIKIVLDCANGAAYKVAPAILWELEAEVITINATPNGANINSKCGSTDTKQLCNEVLKHQAHIGFALDGDADRIAICDENGKIIDGDQILAAIAKYQKENGLLRGNGIVATSMSNIALEKYLKTLDLHLERTEVGDRYVSKFMRDNGYNLGGEQSGHIICADHSTTGDGLVAALQILSVMVDSKKKASEVFSLFKAYPQVLKSIKCHSINADAVIKSKEISKLIKNNEKLLNGNGRIVIRKSGTEPLIRVMVEGKEKKLISQIADSIIEGISKIS